MNFERDLKIPDRAFSKPQPALVWFALLCQDPGLRKRPGRRGGAARAAISHLEPPRRAERGSGSSGEAEIAAAVRPGSTAGATAAAAGGQQGKRGAGGAGLCGGGARGPRLHRERWVRARRRDVRPGGAGGGLPTGRDGAAGPGIL